MCYSCSKRSARDTASTSPLVRSYCTEAHSVRWAFCYPRKEGSMDNTVLVFFGFALAIVAISNNPNAILEAIKQLAKHLRT